MKYAPLIVEEWKKCAAEKVLLVDDAYDPPVFGFDHAGALLDLLEDGKRSRLVPDSLLDAETASKAIDDLTESAYDTEAVEQAYAAVYRSWVDGRDEKVDLGGRFQETKAASLEKLDGLVGLLRRCDGLQIELAGGETAEAVFRKFQPHILFMDYYLSPPERSGQTANAEQGASDEKRSITLVKSLLEKARGAGPSVILMSSEDIADNGGSYRAELEGAVLALRFGFLHKDGVSLATDDLSVESKAADLLLDTAQGFAFGKDVEQALTVWRTGAETALKELTRELRDLDVRDFAYLLRFRLQEEGESFADYLEWFLGESLRGTVDETVEWDRPAFTRIDNPKAFQDIEGGHPHPSDRIARLFHRLRFSMPTKRSKKRFALGDVFVNEARNAVRVVLSPDCDLVPRGKGRPSAPRLLTLGGKLEELTADGAFIGEFVMLDERPMAIKWSLKDVATSSMAKRGEIVVDGVTYTLLGTLRQQHAQNVQAQALADLGRVGLAVAPAVYRTARVEVVIIEKGGAKRILAEKELAKYPATLLYARGGKEKEHRVLFDRSYVRALIASLSQIDGKTLEPANRNNLAKFVEETAKVSGPLQREGLMIGSKGPFGSGIAKETYRKGGEWLQFVVKMDDERA